MMKKRGRIGGALFLALVMATSLVMVPKVQAANEVEIGRTDCSIDFQLAGNWDGKDDVSVPVKLYKIASINGSGAYKAEGDFSALTDVEQVDSDTTAAQWEALAVAADGMVKDSTMAAKEFTVGTTGGTASDLATGLYLIKAETARSATNEYTFSPALVSLPNNYYASTGNDDWIYNLTGANAASLKAEVDPLYGSLVINKTLTTQNVTMTDAATFVFKVDITTDGVTADPRYVTITMNSAGDAQSEPIEKIPVGSTVVVSEIYNGASYELTSADNQQVTITAGDTPESVSFSNNIDGRTNGGYGVENSFRTDGDGQYQWYKDGVLQE